ncbi:Uu.00g112250.m01.CDS01 [Anthostomella pinea]|uniref:Uu.00g112250.m01.CDS01 n=1 Tax=Anthostomella pinea TaxID=933095 RepID=A0AAI8VFR8_9PEZI|nr:Uu.00g112250.m01.CDS01 [Anthostomella pinea]
MPVATRATIEPRPAPDSGKRREVSNDVHGDPATLPRFPFRGSGASGPSPPPASAAPQYMTGTPAPCAEVENRRGNHGYITCADAGNTVPLNVLVVKRMRELASEDAIMYKDALVVCSTLMIGPPLRSSSELLTGWGEYRHH